MEKLVISNSSPLDADVTFCFLNDNKADVYFLDPPTMFLKPSEKQVTNRKSRQRYDYCNSITMVLL